MTLLILLSGATTGQAPAPTIKRELTVRDRTPTLTLDPRSTALRPRRRVVALTIEERNDE